MVVPAQPHPPSVGKRMIATVKNRRMSEEMACGLATLCSPSHPCGMGVSANVVWSLGECGVVSRRMWCVL